MNKRAELLVRLLNDQHSLMTTADVVREHISNHVGTLGGHHSQTSPTTGTELGA